MLQCGYPGIIPAVALDGGRTYSSVHEGSMRGFGYALIAVGVLGLLVGIAMDTSVSGGIGTVNRVVNISLLIQQTATLIVSGFLFMTGCMLIGFSTVRDAIEQLGSMMKAGVGQSGMLRPQHPRPEEISRAISEPSVDWSATKTCPKCYALSAANAVKCSRCGREFEAQPSGAIVAGSRVHHPSFGAGTVQTSEGDNATVLFDGREKPMPMNTAYLKLAVP